jgi:hypothetical protein
MGLYLDLRISVVDRAWNSEDNYLKYDKIELTHIHNFSDRTVPDMYTYVN